MVKDKMKNEKILVLLLVVLVAALVATFFFFMLNPPSGVPNKGAVRVYFIKQDKLSPVGRKVREGKTKEESALKDLVAGPSKEEKEKGLFSHVPAATKVKAVSVEDGIAFINFSKELNQYGGGAEKVRSMIAQIVYTLTDLPHVKKVRILVEGKSDVVLGGEGYVIDKPLTRRDVKL